MNAFARLSCATALTTVLTSPLALADVTSDDVWQNIQDYIAVFDSEATLSARRNGDGLSISDMVLAFELPRDAGALKLTLPGVRLADNGDGTVAITYPAPASYRFSATIKDLGTFAGSLDFLMSEQKTIASGVPGDISYTYSMDRADFNLKDVRIDAPEDVTVSLGGTLRGFSGTVRITAGDLITTRNDFTLGDYDYTVSILDGKRTENTLSGKAEGLRGTTANTLPRGGLDVMNLAAALARGLSLTAATQADHYESSDTTKSGDVIVSDQTSRAATYAGGLKWNKDGIEWTADTTKFFMSLLLEEFPTRIDLTAEHAGGRMFLPISALPDLQDVEMVMSVDGLRIDEKALAMVDPEQALPRDPMTLKLDLTAKVKNMINWFDFATVMALEDSGIVPVELHEMTLNTLDVEMAGARLTGTGAATFDNSDLEATGGFPKPEGAMDLSLIGANTLLDTLVAMGLVTDEQATGVRMMTAVVAVPDPEAGEDALKTRLEINREGHILANGQRIQ